MGVLEAKALASQLGVGTKCSDEAGRLLRLLAASRPGGLIGEIGAGCGVGTAWLLGGASADARLVTVEREAARAESVARLFADDPRLTVLSGDWELIAAHAPFDLLFVDAAPPKHHFPERVLPLVARGGMVVFDDLTPLPEGTETHDPLRSFWHGLLDWTVMEVQIGPSEAALLAVCQVNQSEDG
jgi:predicted O-methyltransferase YrrM